MTVPDATTEVSREAKRARLAVNAVFLTNGAIFANLLPRYPELKTQIGLSNAEFGLAVSAFPLGALIAGLAAGLLINRFSSALVSTLGIVVTAVGILGAGWAPHLAVLGLALFVGSAADAITDVAMNAHGLRVQRRYGRSILNSFHAVWSVGAVIGGGMGAFAAQLAVPLRWHLAVSGVLFSAVALVSRSLMLPGTDRADRVSSKDHAGEDPALVIDPESSAVPSPVGRRIPVRLLGVVAIFGLIAIAGGLVEDAGASWGAIYLTGAFAAAPAVAGLAFIALQGVQFLGRSVADRLVDRYGQRLVAQVGGALVLISMGLALTWPTLVGTIVAFGVSGLGIATLIPAAMHAADELPGLNPGSGLTVVSWMLRIGFLASPPIVGAIADATDLRWGLLVVPLAGLIALLFAVRLPGRVRAVGS